MLRVIILVIAIGAGGMAAWLALSMLPRETAAKVVTAPVEQPRTEVLVASGDLEQGQVLDEKSVRWQFWPNDAVNPDFISRSDRPDAMTSLNGAIVRSHFVSGEPIRDEKLFRGASGMLAAMLPSGKRAVAIRVSAESTAGGFILPNDRVDVIQHIAGADGGQGEARSRTLLRNIRVLAVDQKADEGKGQAVVVGKTVTLEVSPAQAEVVVAGQAAGSVLSLALRSFADSDEKSMATEDRSVTVRIVRTGQSEIVKVQSERSSDTGRSEGVRIASKRAGFQ
jgi:pilus assembly protein CpaB